MIEANVHSSAARQRRSSRRLWLAAAATLTALLVPRGAEARTDEAIIGDVRGGKRAALTLVDAATMRRLHNFRGKYYYISREIGQGAVRSLLGCLENSNSVCRKLCADNLYQLQLTYVHRRALVFYLKKEAEPSVRLALQDLLARINEERFAQARRTGDVNFLAKIAYSEIADFAEKGYPSGERYTRRDFLFLAAGLHNPDPAMQVYTARMLGRIQGQSGSIQRFLLEQRGKTAHANVRSAIDESLSCLRNPSRCPDLQQ